VTITATSVVDPTRSASVVVFLGGFVPIRVNAGGPSHYDPTGTFWYGDTGSTTGNLYSAGTLISNTQTPYLYQSERFAANAQLIYKFYVPNGNYTVKLKFAEIFFTSANQRVVQIDINGARVERNFDALAVAGGANRAFDKSYPVAVTNGQIQITLSPVNGSAPKVSAIEIQ
jgi:hypothetical protein